MSDGETAADRVARELTNKDFEGIKGGFYERCNG